MLKVAKLFRILLPEAIVSLEPTRSSRAKRSWLPASTCKAQAVLTGHGSCPSRKHASMFNSWAEAIQSVINHCCQCPGKLIPTLLSLLFWFLRLPNSGFLPHNPAWLPSSRSQCFTLWPDDCHHPYYLCRSLDSGFDVGADSYSLVPTLTIWKLTICTSCSRCLGPKWLLPPATPSLLTTLCSLPYQTGSGIRGWWKAWTKTLKCDSTGITGEMRGLENLYFLGSKITADGDCSHEIKRLAPWKQSYDQPRQHITKQRHYFADKGPPPSQSYGFSGSHVQMWELDHKEMWAQKNWCFSNTVVLEKTPESPLDCKEIQPVNPKGNQSQIYIHWKDRCWSWNSNTLATSSEELTYWKRPWSRERLRAGGEGDDTRWDGWMASPTRWTWVWASSGKWWWTGKPGVLRSMGSQRVGHDWATELRKPEAQVELCDMMVIHD